MKLNTKYHGMIDYEEKDIIIFKKGLPGFENLKKFILFPVEANEVFNILHSIEDEKIGIVVVSPFYSIQNYEFELSDEKIKELQIERKKDVLVLTTVTLNSRIENMTVNLKAPIVININKHLGEQIILDDSNYLIKYPIMGTKY